MSPPKRQLITAAGGAHRGILPSPSTICSTGNTARHGRLCWIVLLLILFCFVGPLIYRTNQTTVNLGISNLPPGPGHPLGTDEYGIDILGRLMVGGQSSLELGFSVAITSTVIGALYGAISGMVGGIFDAFLMRIVDTLLAVHPHSSCWVIVASMFTLRPDWRSSSCTDPCSPGLTSAGSSEPRCCPCGRESSCRRRRRWGQRARAS